MNREEIIKLAREAGLFVPHEGITKSGAFMRFATILAAAERERCVKVCEEYADWLDTLLLSEDLQKAAWAVRQAVKRMRAMGE